MSLSSPSPNKHLFTLKPKFPDRWTSHRVRSLYANTKRREGARVRVQSLEEAFPSCFFFSSPFSPALLPGRVYVFLLLCQSAGQLVSCCRVKKSSRRSHSRSICSVNLHRNHGLTFCCVSLNRHLLCCHATEVSPLPSQPHNPCSLHGWQHGPGVFTAAGVLAANCNNTSNINNHFLVRGAQRKTQSRDGLKKADDGVGRKGGRNTFSRAGIRVVTTEFQLQQHGNRSCLLNLAKLMNI